MERRKVRRIGKRLDALFGPNEPPDTSGITLDISVGGLCIKSHRIFGPGTPLNIQLMLQDKRVDLAGEVVWAKRVPPTLARIVKKSGMGIRLAYAPKPYTQFVAEEVRQRILTRQ